MAEKTNTSIGTLMANGGRRKGSRREIRIIDTTLRDAHQSLWATRMRTEHISAMAPDLDQAGFEHVDLVAPIQFDVAVRYLKEDPWERVRTAHRLAPNTRFRSLVRSRNIAAFDFLPDDVIEKWVERSYANGFRVIGAFDGLNDVDNIAGTLRRAKSLGATTFGALSFCESPVHTDELYVRTARDLIAKADVDHIMLKDAGGLLTPERMRSLIPAVKAVIGDRPLELHSHCLTALAPLVYLEGVELGCDMLHTSISPLANGSGQPATQSMARALREMGYVVNVDDARIAEVSDYLTRTAKREKKPLGRPLEYDPLHYKHQLPGGMLSNFEAQLAAAGLSHRFEELLEEIARVRAELAWPIMITPFAQFVGTQAVINVMTGERYRQVPDEIKKYACGYYGKLLAPIAPDVLDRIMENGSGSIRSTPTEPEPMWDDLRRHHSRASDDELLLRAMFAGNQVDEMKAAILGRPQGSGGPTSVLDLVKSISATPPGTRVQVRLPGLSLGIVR